MSSILYEIKKILHDFKFNNFNINSLDKESTILNNNSLPVDSTNEMICTSCNGIGEQECYCGGNSSCLWCNGIGIIPCDSCNGSGIKNTNHITKKIS